MHEKSEMNWPIRKIHIHTVIYKRVPQMTKIDWLSWVEVWQISVRFAQSKLNYSTKSSKTEKCYRSFTKKIKHCACLRPGDEIVDNRFLEGALYLLTCGGVNALIDIMLPSRWCVLIVNHYCMSKTN